jgi:phosphoribosylaminoimidazole-succinocarboxamide synthase
MSPTPTNPLLGETALPLPLFYRGKVRDSYDLGDKLLLVATDRVSAFDSVLPSLIPDKGRVLNGLSAFWFQKTTHIVPSHLIANVDKAGVLDAYLPSPSSADLIGRSMIVHKAQRVPVECVVRGYLAGSAWEEYRGQGPVFDLPLPPGLKESQELPQPLFTPTTKADSGHDQPLSPPEVVKLVGEELAQDIQEKSLAIYNYAREYARTRGIIIADTKFEFGLIDGKLALIDELLTPDSSRFWDINKYEVGRSQPSFDKQPLRDWLVASGWNKEPPAPPLPPEVVEQTAERYREAHRRLTGRSLD